MLKETFFALSLLATTATADTIFPTYTSLDLNGDSHTLPADLPGDPTIVFIAYKQRQQDAVNTWINALELDPSIGPEFVELPVVGSATTMIRSYVDNGMRSGIVDTNLRRRTITLYENASEVNAPLGFQGRGQIRVLLVRPSGEVLWQTSGPATTEGVEALKQAYADAL